MQDGDAPETFADTAALAQWVGFRPHTPLAVGIDRFVRWYATFHR